jgi:hypothetical protein
LKAFDPFAFTVDRRIDEAGRDGIDPNSDCDSQRQVAVIFFALSGVVLQGRGVRRRSFMRHRAVQAVWAGRLC